MRKTLMQGKQAGIPGTASPMTASAHLENLVNDVWDLAELGLERMEVYLITEKVSERIVRTHRFRRTADWLHVAL